MTLLIVMHGTEMNVKSVFALLLEEVTRPKQAYSERRIAYRKKKYQRRYR